jgi:hypothetical protein
MRSLVFAFVLTAGAAHAAPPLNPIQCSQTADVFFALLHGQPANFPSWMQPVLMKAAEHYRDNQSREPYWHTTRLFMECLRAGGVPEDMYDPRHMADPEKPRKRA